MTPVHHNNVRGQKQSKILEKDYKLIFALQSNVQIMNVKKTCTLSSNSDALNSPLQISHKQLPLFPQTLIKNASRFDDMVSAPITCINKSKWIC